jgi:hypothetical protein|tara:strand:- start:237 stop:449 length:213 start_codon:yes stop_codon:yes gene_type:complete
MEDNNTITVDGVDYNLDDFTDEQRILLNHVTDLDAKLANARFNFDQLTVSREAFAEKLAASLETKLEAAE